jgi:hypothetical protein
MNNQFERFVSSIHLDKKQNNHRLPLANFMMQLGALLTVLIVSMVLILAIREEQATLRIAAQVRQ